MELEGIDRMYLNAYVPQLTSERGIAAFCRGYLGHRFGSTKQAVAMTEAFVKSIRTFIQQEGLELVRFQKGQRGIAFEALDNGRLSGADVPAAQRICDGLSAPKIDAFFRKWLARLPHPYSAKDRRAGYRYD